MLNKRCIGYCTFLLYASAPFPSIHVPFLRLPQCWQTQRWVVGPGKIVATKKKEESFTMPFSTIKYDKQACAVRTISHNDDPGRPVFITVTDFLSTHFFFARCFVFNFQQILMHKFHPINLIGIVVCLRDEKRKRKTTIIFPTPECYTHTPRISLHKIYFH